MGDSIPSRLVVRGVNWLGDAIMSMPALVRLRQALPKTQIALLTAEKLVDLWRGHEAIDEVLTFSRQEGVGQVSAKLKAAQFDAALILPNSFRSGFEAWMAGIPVRVGYGRRLLLNRQVQPRREHIRMHKRSATEIKKLIAEQPSKPRDSYPLSAHHLHQYLRLVSFFGASEAPLRPSIKISGEEANAFTEKFGVGRGRPVIGLNPGAEYGPAKRWPVEQFVEVTRGVQAQWIVFGGPGDAQTCAEMVAAIPGALNVAGKTSLRELAVGLSICDAVLTNDTGPMHLAAAVGARVVVPFGSTSPELTGPGMPGEARHRLVLGNVPCAPCFLRVCPIDFRCMRSIEAERVVGELKRLLDGNDQ